MLTVFAGDSCSGVMHLCDRDHDRIALLHEVARAKDPEHIVHEEAALVTRDAMSTGRDSALLLSDYMY